MCLILIVPTCVLVCFIYLSLQPLNNLKWMDLRNSSNLKELADLSTATNLQELDLSHCYSLVELSLSIGNAINLQKNGSQSLLKASETLFIYWECN